MNKFHGLSDTVVQVMMNHKLFSLPHNAELLCFMFYLILSVLFCVLYPASELKLF